MVSAQVQDNTGIIVIYFCSNCLYGIKLVYLSLAGTFTSVIGSKCAGLKVYWVQSVLSSKCTGFKVYTNIQGYSQCCSQMTPARSPVGGTE